MTVRGHTGPLKDSILIQRVVARTPWVLAASPGWLNLHGIPGTPEDIGPNQVLGFSHTPDWQAWVITKEGIERRIEVAPRLISDDMISLRTSAIVGGGITCLPGYLLKPSLDSGRTDQGAS